MSAFNPSYAEIANSFSLWVEYIDPDGNVSRKEFDKMTIEQRIELMKEIFGADEAIDDDIE